ncbi:ATP-binding protein [Brevundimonas sp. DC300-4]|uniref:hybrid sensor histidine kinase/response regulator n=1 Tax=Brevundimonas sp. DC300-4 TaxID=2804594 RepID=UPI003CF41717
MNKKSLQDRFQIGETAALTLAILIVVASLIFLLWRAAVGVDEIADSSERELMRNGLAARSAELRAAVVPQANWDGAVANLDQNFDPVWAAANVGTFLTQTSGFDLVSVLDSRETVVFSRDKDGPASPAVETALAAHAIPLISEIRRREIQRGPFRLEPGNTRMISSPIQASAVSQIAGAPYIVVATLVRPDFGTALPGDLAPVIVTAEAIDSSFIGVLADRYDLQDAQIVPIATPLPSDKVTITIDDQNGQPFLSLRWTSHRPAIHFISITWPYIVAFVTISAAAIFYFSLVARRSQRSLKVALAAAEQASRSKSEFLASMSHEIRTPLNGVIVSLHLLKTEPLTSEGKKLLEAASSSGELVNSVINDILDFSKIEAGKMSLSPETTDIKRLVQLIAATFEPQCLKKGLAFRCRIDPLVGEAHLDPLRLNQCLFNLIGNAVKFTPEGHVEMIVTSVERDEGRVLCFDVSDTGIGISTEAQAGLFQRFEQADRSTTRTFGGTGLGLAITRKIAEQMGGGVHLVSEAGKGSTFHLEIPAPHCGPQQATEAQDAGDSLLDGTRVLVVDDNTTNLLIASTLLRRMGAVVETAQSGPESIEMALNARFDVILMDIQMPEMDGLETTRRMRDLAGRIGRVPVIALTANVLDSHRAEYMAAGMDGVVGKPISPALLLQEILLIGAAERATVSAA